MADTVRVTGCREFLRACAHADKHLRRETRAAFKEVGEIVRADAQRLFQVVDVRTAAGYRTVVRQRGVAVEQSLGKTTGQHPEYGPKQMRDALLPALAMDEGRVEQAMEHAIDTVADLFEREG